jgi:hypothetical protein
MNFTLVVIFSFSIFIAAMIGCIRFKKISPMYYPFLYCLWIGSVNEILSYILVKTGFSTAINISIYVLAESLLFTWQFKNWGLFKRSKILFPILIVSLILFWSVENFFIGGLQSPISYFRIFHSLLISIMSLNIINNQLNLERKNIIKNPIFLICIVFVIYFTCDVIVGLFWLYGLHMSMKFQFNLAVIIIYTNLFANLIYVLAVLWMPLKHRFTLPY